MVMVNVPVHVARILFNNDAQPISFNSAEKWQEKMVPKHDLVKQIIIHNGENHILSFAVHIDNAGVIQKTHIMYILEACHGKFDNFSTRKCQQLKTH